MSGMVFYLQNLVLARSDAVLIAGASSFQSAHYCKRRTTPDLALIGLNSRRHISFLVRLLVRADRLSVIATLSSIIRLESFCSTYVIKRFYTFTSHALVICGDSGFAEFDEPVAIV
jgi:hypothetical protein